MNRKEQQVEELLAPTVASLGCVIWGVEFLNQGKHSKLRLYIERHSEAMNSLEAGPSDTSAEEEVSEEEMSEGGVTVDDCAAVSRHVSDILDVEEFSNNAYTLEVSSPGMDRILFKPYQYLESLGEQIDVRLNFPFEGRKKFVGRLAGIEDNQVVLQVADDEYLLPLENVQRARIVPTFE